jgi:hypothetical protein
VGSDKSEAKSEVLSSLGVEVLVQAGLKAVDTAPLWISTCHLPYLSKFLLRELIANSFKHVPNFFPIEPHEKIIILDT